MRTFIAIMVICVVASGVLLFLHIRQTEVRSTESDLCWGTPCERVNHRRDNHGLVLLRQKAGLTDIADDWAHHLAVTQDLIHNPNLKDLVCCWSLVGENVGYGPDEKTIFLAFMASPEHRDNILEPRYRLIGIGRERDITGRLWLVQVFKRPL